MGNSLGAFPGAFFRGLGFGLGAEGPGSLGSFVLLSAEDGLDVGGPSDAKSSDLRGEDELTRVVGFCLPLRTDRASGESDEGGSRDSSSCALPLPLFFCGTSEGFEVGELSGDSCGNVACCFLGGGGVDMGKA
jgi:hypothetical protein